MNTATILYYFSEFLFTRYREVDQSGRAVRYFFLWPYSPILGLDRLRETFRFISVTRSRTAGRTPWTGDQLVARPLLPAPDVCDDEVSKMNGFDRGN
jgi:hypothetical protein